MTMTNLAKCIYSAAIGDALGVPYEFRDRGDFLCTDMIGYGTYNQPAGTWSDDTSMLLATCKSIKDNGGAIDTDDIMQRFADWYYRSEFTPHGETFDVGGATSLAITTGQPQAGELSNGNGSLMRIAPLAFLDCSDNDVRAVSAITHAHHISMDACVIFVRLLRDALTGAPSDALAGYTADAAPSDALAGYTADAACVTDAAPSDGARPAGSRLADLVHALDLPAPFDRLSYIDTLGEDDIQSTGYVVHTLEAAIWCVLTSDTLPECLLKAVNLGSDTDTTAAVAGALAIAKFDFDQMPANWIEGLQAKDIIDACLF